MTARACPDCPAHHDGVFSALLPEGPRPCALRVASLANREPLPAAWSGRYALALVRRGIVVRQRVDRSGHATAVDAVGSGSALLLGSSESDVSGYAAGDAVLCLCPARALEADTCGALGTARDLARLQARAIDRMERIAQARSRPTLGERVAHLLCTLADTLSPGRRLDVIPADLQQRDLAALLGARHESVCRALGWLENAGAARRSPTGIVLRSRDLLER
jgi:hypothetical protein